MSAGLTLAKTVENYSFVTTIGFGQGKDNEQFDGLCDIAIDSSNNIYTVEKNNGRVQKIDASGNFVTTWGAGSGNGEGILNSPTGIAVDSSGNVYVADESNQRIQKFDSDGKFIVAWGENGNGNGQFSYPSDVAVDSSGNVFVADNWNNRIQEFDSSGKYIKNWGIPGDGAGQLKNPYSLSIAPSGNIYVMDGDSRVQEFTPKGDYVTGWGSRGNGDSQFYNPGGVTVDSDGNVFVVDAGNNRIEKFDSSGNLLVKWGIQGSGNGQLNSPNAIAFDSNRNAFVTEWWNYRIQEFSHANVTVIPPTAEFMADKTTGVIPLTVKFTDMSKNANLFKWDFGDGQTSTEQNPTHTYYTAGKYTVKLQAAGNGSDDTNTKTDYITASNVGEIPTASKPAASFSASPLSGDAPLKVSFTDTSTGTPTTWSWDFGDGQTSTVQNPTHTYTVAGSYKVRLTVSNDAGIDTASQSTIFVTGGAVSTTPGQTSTPGTATTPSDLTPAAHSSASVKLYAEKTEVKKGENIQLKLSAVNLITKPTMHVQVILSPPSGMSVSSDEFVESGAGQYTATFDLEPGKGKDIEVKIAANQVGKFNVEGRVVYYFKSKTDGDDYTLELPIDVSSDVPTAEETTPGSTSKPPIPDIGVVGSVFILMTAFVLIRKKI